jgi:hypothetical protein
MQASDNFPLRPSPWRRFARTDIADGRKDMAGLISQELRLVFSVAQAPDDLADVHRLLEEIEKRKHGR